jgi:transcriptional regulator with XRE-family HTH domain
MRTQGQLLLLKLTKKASEGRIARKCGVTQPVISMWISGRRKPNYENRKTMAEQLGIAMDAWDQIVEDTR